MGDPPDGVAGEGGAAEAAARPRRTKCHSWLHISFEQKCASR